MMNRESSYEEAAAWAARLDAGPLQPDEARALMDWLGTDAANEAQLEEIQRLHQKVRLMVPEMVADGQLPEPSRKRAPRFFAWAGAVATVLVVAVVWWVQRPARFFTAAAQVQTVTLTDGTRVEMNAVTAIAVRQRGHERHVDLDGGEVFLTVAKDPSRPFIVETATARVRVTGTVFDVRAETADTLTVTVMEGSVSVTSLAGGETSMLKPGDELSITGGRIQSRHLSAGDTANAIAWRSGRIVFKNTPLKEALERFAHHHGRAIEVAPEVEGYELGGRFNLNDYEAFLRDVEVAVPVRVLREGDGRVRVVAR